jgi:hypothetical protein
MLPLLGTWKEVLFPGFVATIFGLTGAIVGLRRSARKDTVVLYIAIGLLACWLSFGPEAGLYSVMYRAVPAFSLMRAPARFAIVLVLALSVLAALSVTYFIRLRPYGRRVACGLVLTAAAELTVIPLDWREAEPVAAPYRALAALPVGPVVELPFWYLRPDFPRHAYYMLNSTAHWQPLINGYSDFLPSAFRENVLPISTFPSREAFAVLQRHGARYVVFHATFYSHRMLPRVTAAIEEYRTYLRPLARDDKVWLYEIVAWPE